MLDAGRRFRAAYGSGPLHLLAALASFAVCAYALLRVLGELGDPLRFVIWLGGSIVAHDLLLLPLYSVLGLAAGRAMRLVPSERLRIAALNHLRVPALLSGLLLLVWFPLVAGRGSGSYMAASGLSNEVYLGRWLLLSGVMLGASALLFALRLRSFS